jgi:hypothetical protein
VLEAFRALSGVTAVFMLGAIMILSPLRDAGDTMPGAAVHSGLPASDPVPAATPNMTAFLPPTIVRPLPATMTFWLVATRAQEVLAIQAQDDLFESPYDSSRILYVRDAAEEQSAAQIVLEHLLNSGSNVITEVLDLRSDTEP